MDRIYDFETEEEAEAYAAAHDAHFECGAPGWLWYGSLDALARAYRDDPDCYGSLSGWASEVDEWWNKIHRVCWRQQLREEVAALDRGEVPVTVTPTSELLGYALYAGRCDLVRLLAPLTQINADCIKVLLEADLRPLESVLQLLFSHTVINEEMLPTLTCKELFPYALPFLGDFLHLLAHKCECENLMMLKERGVRIDFPEVMINAFRTQYANKETIESWFFMRDNVEATAEVLAAARESRAYWILYASEAEKAEVLERCPLLSPLIRQVFDPNQHRLHFRPVWTREMFLELPLAPTGVAFDIARNTYFPWRVSIPQLVWPNTELRDLLAHYPATCFEARYRLFQ